MLRLYVVVVGYVLWLCVVAVYCDCVMWLCVCGCVCGFCFVVVCCGGAFWLRVCVVAVVV